jgi:hypothetical protein
MNNLNIEHRAARAKSIVGGVGVFALVIALGMPSRTFAQAPFNTPEAAADALIDAIASNDVGAMPRLLGKNWRQVLPLDTVERDKVYAFLEKTNQARKVNISGARAELVVGDDPWTLPIPLLQGKDGQWRFDPVGAQEVIAERRIGANERAAMRATLAYVDAQREYATADRNGDGVLEYAQKLISSPGKRDGLIWSPALGDESPLGEAYQPAKSGEGYHGYHYKILTGQGPKANGGARSYLIGQRMTAGFALLAWPVKYGTTGVTSFMVNSDGELFERDLGPQTPQVARALTRFNPDDAWQRVQP